MHNKTLEALATPCNIYIHTECRNRRQTATGFQHYCKNIDVLTRKVCCQIVNTIVWIFLCKYIVHFRAVVCLHFIPDTKYQTKRFFLRHSFRRKNSLKNRRVFEKKEDIFMFAFQKIGHLYEISRQSFRFSSLLFKL